MHNLTIQPPRFESQPRHLPLFWPLLVPTSMQFVKFTCQMNEWDPERRTCDAQEEDYDNEVELSDKDDEIIKRVRKRVLKKKVPSQKAKKAETKRARTPKKK